MLRRVLLCLMAAGLIAAGGYIILLQLLYAQSWYYRGIIAAGFMIWFGFALLWEGFVVPRRKRHTATPPVTISPETGNG